ncbi:MAG TPA: DUF3800 domain-containing protein, partial [Cyclobacteriaceae bacterium]
LSSMIVFLDESGDLGWSFSKPNREGGSSRFITVAGVVFDERQLKSLIRHLYDLMKRNKLNSYTEKEGSSFFNDDAVALVKSLATICETVPTLQIISITADKQKVPLPLRRDTVIFYNHLLNNLLATVIQRYDDIDVVLDNRKIRIGSRNSFEDCIRARCWGELGLNTNISCRYENSERNPCIWLADWLSNFTWRHYEHKMHDPYIACLSHGPSYHEKTLFM